MVSLDTSFKRQRRSEHAQDAGKDVGNRMSVVQTKPPRVSSSQMAVTAPDLWMVQGSTRSAHIADVSVRRLITQPRPMISTTFSFPTEPHGREATARYLHIAAALPLKYFDNGARHSDGRNVHGIQEPISEQRSKMIASRPVRKTSAECLTSGSVSSTQFHRVSCPCPKEIPCEICVGISGQPKGKPGTGATPKKRVVTMPVWEAQTQARQ